MQTKARTRTAERRAAPRFAPNPETSCQLCAADEGPPVPAEVANIAATGIRVRVRRSYAVGTPLVLELAGKGGNLRRTLAVRVARVTSDGEGFALGCSFAAPLEGHELLTLVL